MRAYIQYLATCLVPVLSGVGELRRPGGTIGYNEIRRETKGADRMGFNSDE